MVAGGCPGCRGAAGIGLRDAVDGGLGGAARLFYCAAAGIAQRGESTDRADGSDRGHLVRPEPGRGAGRGRQVHRRPCGNGPERSRLLRDDGPVLPAGGGIRIRCGPCPTPGGPGQAAVGDPVASGGRALPCQRAPHRRKYAGARVPDGLSAARRGPQRRRGPIRQFERDGPAAADLSLRAAGELVRSADAGDYPSPHPGRGKAAFGLAGPDAAADGLLLRAGGGGVLGVGRPAGRPSVRGERGRGGLLSDSPWPGHAADVP